MYNDIFHFKTTRLSGKVRAKRCLFYVGKIASVLLSRAYHRIWTYQFSFVGLFSFVRKIALLWRLFDHTSNIQYRAVIKVFIRKRLSATEATTELTDIYSYSALSYRTVAKLVAEFNDPTRTFEDASRSGQSLTAVTDESIRAVEEVMVDKFLFDA